MSKRVILEGVEYPTLSAACKHYNISNATVTKRLKAGWTPEQAFGVGVTPPEKHQAFGRDFGSYQEVAQFYDLPYSTLSKYARSCNSLEEAIARTQTVARRKRYNQVVIAGVTYDSIPEATTTLGIPLSNVYAYMRQGLNPQDSINQVIELERIKSERYPKYKK